MPWLETATTYGDDRGSVLRIAKPLKIPKTHACDIGEGGWAVLCYRVLRLSLPLKSLLSHTLVQSGHAVHTSSQADSLMGTGPVSWKVCVMRRDLNIFSTVRLHALDTARTVHRPARLGSRYDANISNVQASVIPSPHSAGCGSSRVFRMTIESATK